MLINHTGMYKTGFCHLEKFHQRAFSVKYSTKASKTVDISTSCLPPGWSWVSKKREKPTEFNFIGSRCNHEV